MTQSEPVKDAPHVATVLKLAVAMRRYAISLSAVVAVVAIVAGFVVRGTSGGVGAVVGVVVGAGLGLLSAYVMVRTARSSPVGVMIGAMSSFGAKIAFMLVLLLVFRDTTLFDNQVFAFTLLAMTIAYIGGEVLGFVRGKIPVVDL